METKHVPKWRKLGLKLKQPQEVHAKIDVHGKESKEEGSDKRSTASLPKPERRIEKSTNQRHDIPSGEARKGAERILDQQESSNKKRKVKRKKKSSAVTKPQPPSDADKRALTYLELYHSNRASWKFSKGLQNWILRNVDVIPGQYEEALLDYLTTLQGAARARLVEEASNRSEPRFLRLVGLLHEE